MLTLSTPNEAEKFVRRQKRLGNDVWWENYTIVFFRPSPKGYYSKDGVFHNGEWGFANQSPVEDDGTWKVDYRNVKHARAVRN